jgi:hypothetical protein
MRSLNLKKLVAVSALGMVAVLGTSEAANAQGRYDRDDWKQERKISKQQEKIEKQRAKIEQQRMRNQQMRQAQQNRRYGNNNAYGSRYRVYRNGSYYNTDQRGADLLRQAVNAGYQRGFEAGRGDRNSRRRGSYSNSSIYRSGTYGYQSHVSQSQYQYYFRQGFQRGYQDGVNSRYDDDYQGQYQYGYNDGGQVSILGTILSQILNIQTY